MNKQDTTTHSNNTYKGLPTYPYKGPLSNAYLMSIERLLSNALVDHKRTLVIRFDLRFPNSFIHNHDLNDTAIISRFTDSLKAKIKHDITMKQRTSTKVHRCNVRFVWVKEIDTSSTPHYHVALLLNADKYAWLGKFDSEQINMANRIKSAWCSALRYECEGVVHFPENHTYTLDYNASNYNQMYCDVFYRLSYFAKFHTKAYGNNKRTFGCSNR